MSKIRIGFVGVGRMGQAAHLRNYVTLPDAEVVAIAEIRPKLGRDVAARYGIKMVYPGHAQMLATEDLDAIVAIQPFGSHVDLVPELLQKRVPLLTEKPLAESLENGEKVYAAARTSGTPLYLAYHKRSDPATSAARKQMDDWSASGVVGKLRYLRVTMPPGDWVADGFTHNVGTDEKYVAKPCDWNDPYVKFVNYYIHQVNLIRHLVGDYRIISADPNGLTFTAVTDAGVTIVLEMQPYSTTLDWQESALICFEKGWIKLKLPAPLAVNRAGMVTIYEDTGSGATPKQFEPTLPWIHAMRQQAVNFVKAVKGERTPLATAEDGLKDLRVAAQYIELVSAAKSG
jgi:predicted dehydrogenase